MHNTSKVCNIKGEFDLSLNKKEPCISCCKRNLCTVMNNEFTGKFIQHLWIYDRKENPQQHQINGKKKGTFNQLGGINLVSTITKEKNIKFKLGILMFEL